MQMKSIMSPDSGTLLGILTAAGVYLIFNNAMPSLTDIRAADPHDDDVEAARKGAAWKSAGLIGVVFLVSRDINSYVISGAALVGADYMVKHANAVHPATGKIDNSDMGQTVAPGMAESYSLPGYADADSDVA